MSLFIMPFTSFASEEFEENTQNKTHKFEDTFLDKKFDLKDIKEDHLISIKDTDLKNPTNKFLLKDFLLNRNNKVKIFLSEDGFIKGGILKMSKNDLPSNLKHLFLVDEKGIATSIGKSFLVDCPALKTVDTTGLTSVKSIEYWFLSGCINLEVVDTTGLTSVKSIGGGFLTDCPALKTVDTTGLTSVESIGKSFLAGSKCLKTVDTTGLTSVKSIEVGFLANCHALETVDTTGLTSVKSIGKYLLYNCKAPKVFFITTKRKSFFWNDLLKKRKDNKMNFKIVDKITEKIDPDTVERITWLNDEENKTNHDIQNLVIKFIDGAFFKTNKMLMAM